MAARDAWLKADGDKTKAVQLMRQDPRAAGCKRMDRMVITWGRDFKARGNFEDKARCGRPKQLTDAATLQAASILKAGYSTSSGRRCYTSLSHAAKNSQALQGIVKTANVSKKHLLRKITKIDKGAAFRVLHIKNAFTQPERSQRSRVSKQMLRNFSRAASFSQRIFWVDAKKMHVSLKSQKVWLDNEEPPDTIEDSRAQGARGGLKTLHFYAAVNACEGPTAFVFITGTTGLQREPPYRVSRSKEPVMGSCLQLAHHHVCHLGIFARVHHKWLASGLFASEHSILHENAPITLVSIIKAEQIVPCSHAGTIECPVTSLLSRNRFAMVGVS